MRLLVMCLLFCVGHVSSSELTVNGTLFYNVTGSLRTRVEHVRDILDHESSSYKEIAGNLTREFLQLFTVKTPFDYNVSVVKLFLWPSSYTIENFEEKQNLSFLMIARNTFLSTPEDKYSAETFVTIQFWQIRNKLDEETGIVTLQGLDVMYDTLKLQEIGYDEVNKTINIMTNYIRFITKLTDGDDDEDDPKQAERQIHEEIFIVAYVGIALSTAGLLITMFSICYFRRLRKFRGNQILVQICISVMAGMLLSVLSFLHKGGRKTCIAIAIFLHYFILAALSWMCVEAYNLYRDLVKVFNANVFSNKQFFIRACVFAYGVPAIVVGAVSSIDLDVYGLRNYACWMTSLASVVSFLVPVLLIVFVNIAFFILIMREIVRVSQRESHNIKPSLRAAVSLSVLLGFCWLFAGMSTFSKHPFFQYAFVIMSSFQGLFIFLFHGVGKKEFRDSWKSLPIFNWKFHCFSADSQGRAKTESAQDTAQAGKRQSDGDITKIGRMTRKGGADDAHGTAESETAEIKNSPGKKISCHAVLGTAQAYNNEMFDARFESNISRGENNVLEDTTSRKEDLVHSTKGEDENDEEEAEWDKISSATVVGC